jgi:hypothetical protein
MKPLFLEDEFKNSKSNHKLPCKCYQCDKVYYKTKHAIQIALNQNSAHKNMFCSKKCQSISQITKQTVVCTNCGITFEKIPSKIRKSINHFCSKSCAAAYNNTHKMKGNRRSKLEIYLEDRLKNLYPNLGMDFNKSNAINSELDIYIPSLKLAFELNGIFHYEPIYGDNKLKHIKNNDNRKFQACIERGIELCIIDTTQQKYFKEQTSQKFLNIIIKIIDQHFNTSKLNS